MVSKGLDPAGGIRTGFPGDDNRIIVMTCLIILTAIVGIHSVFLKNKVSNYFKPRFSFGSKFAAQHFPAVTAWSCCAYLRKKELVSAAGSIGSTDTVVGR